MSWKFTSTVSVYPEPHTPGSGEGLSRPAILSILGLLTALAMVTFLLIFRPLFFIGALLHPFGPPLLGVNAAVLVLLSLIVLKSVSSRAGSALWNNAPVITFSSFALFCFAAGLPLQSLASQASGVDVSFDVTGDPPTHVLFVVNDDFGNNALPRPDSMILVDLTDPRSITLTPVLRDWTESKLQSGKSLAEVHFGIGDCAPYCGLSDLVARQALESSQGHELPGTAALAALVVSVELGIAEIRTIETSPKTLLSVFEELSPIELQVERPIPVGGKWVDEAMIDIRYWIPAGNQSLSGQEMVWFARARWTTSNEDRVTRQLQLILAALDQRGLLSLMSAVLSSEGFAGNLTGTDILKLDLESAAFDPQNIELRAPIGD